MLPARTYFLTLLVDFDVVNFAKDEEVLIQSLTVNAVWETADPDFADLDIFLDRSIGVSTSTSCAVVDVGRGLFFG